MCWHSALAPQVACLNLSAILELDCEPYTSEPPHCWIDARYIVLDVVVLDPPPLVSHSDRPRIVCLRPLHLLLPESAVETPFTRFHPSTYIAALKEPVWIIGASAPHGR